MWAEMVPSGLQAIAHGPSELAGAALPSCWCDAHEIYGRALPEISPSCSSIPELGTRYTVNIFQRLDMDQERMSVFVKEMARTN